MSIFDFLTLFGGLAMFLYGMRLMGDGLKESSSGTLKKAMESVTNNPVKAFLLGLAVTAIIQSSTATIVITSGLVAAGLLTLHQSLGIIIGANVGTTVTGQIIRLLDLNASGGTSWLQIFKPSSLAPIALIIGIVLIMGGRFKSARQVGNIAIGFGILFSGLLNMTSAVTVLTESGLVETLFTGLGNNPVLGYLTGAGVAFVLQSSSATIGILQAFASSGLLTFKAVYPVIVGIYLGDSVTTAIVCSIGAGAEQRRVGIVNTLFNLSETVVVLAVVAILHQFGLLDGLWDKVVNSGMIANTNTVFNLSCAIVLFPMLPVYETLSRRIVKDDVVVENKYQDKLDALNPMFFDTPALALRSVYDALLTQLQAVRQNIEKSFGLLRNFDEKIYQEIMDEEANIDLLTDRISRYEVEFLPHLRGEGNAAILNEYYKVVTEFERLGDHAVNIADNAENLYKNNRTFTAAAIEEIGVLEDLLRELLDDTETAFARRDIEAAFRIEPLQQLVSEMVLRLKRHHLVRMGRGECDIFADSNFENLMSDLKRIADVSTNIGEAVLVRVNPELADDEHNYFTALRTGNDKKFNEQYEAANAKYMSRIKSTPQLVKQSEQMETEEDFSEVAD
ncbi:MAG: Na/Pi cotransporter family protein [Lachnospiraceae bacterium]|nr:Na/Pi cotransporter family protein [Lachnospiraceae bacterium]